MNTYFSRQGQGIKRWVFTFLTIFLLVGMSVPAALATNTNPVEAAANPVPVQYYYIPFPEDQLLETLIAIQPGSGSDIERPASPVTNYISIAALAGNTIIYYDQWENGYVADIANPSDIYSALNPAGVQIWGDGVTANGTAPGISSDIIGAGTVVLLNNAVNTSTRQSVIDFDGGDKFAVSKTVAVTHTAWASGSSTLFAGSVEVYDTANWGTDYRAPVGTDLGSSVDYDMFEYTAFYIMAGENDTEVQIDADRSGPFETTVTLQEGQSYRVTGVKAGGRVIADKPVQVDLFTGDIGSNYESRDSALLPFDLWASSYYTPVSTPGEVDGGYNSNDYTGCETTVWLYNPGTAPITVTYERRDGSGVVTTSPINVPAGECSKKVLENGSNGKGSHFYSTSNFYAFSTTDSNSSAYGEDGSGNQVWDWGFTLVPQSSLSPQVLVGLGIGRDPTYGGWGSENGNPVWITTVGNGNTEVKVYVDYDANPETGAFTDANGSQYDTWYNLKSLQQKKIYDNGDDDQTGMLVYVLDNNVKLAAAWGQNPADASPASPGLDVGTCVPPAPLFDCGKNGTLSIDNDGDGFISPGDELLYTITINNIGRLPVSGLLLKDTVPVDTTYVAGSTFFGSTQIADDSGSNTPFPLDEAGYQFSQSIPVGGSFTVTFKVVIDSFTELTPGTTQIVNSGTASAFGSTVKFKDITPIFGWISDFVWYDANVNGLQDAGESGLSGITVELYASDTLIDTTTTDQNGSYIFSGLLAGDYTIKFVLPANYDFTSQTQGIDNSVDSNPDVATGLAAVSLAGGQHNSTVDAGLFIPEAADPSISLDKSWSSFIDTDLSGSITEGDVLTYSYVVTNTGNVTLSAVNVVDNPIGTITPGTVILDPEESTSGTATHTITAADVSAGTVYNSAIATGTPPTGSDVTDTDDVTLVSVKVEKKVLDEYDGTFDFRLTQYSQSYDEFSIETSSGQGSTSFYVTPGTYGVIENVTEEWILFDSYVTPGSAGTAANFVVDNNSAVTVTFENKKLTDPIPSVPEAPAFVLLGIGLLGMAAFITVKKVRYSH